MPWVKAATSITSGLDADKPAIPAIGDMYGATDTQKLYVCFTAGTWTKVSYLANSSSGTLANLPASPQVGDTYFVTDLSIQEACFSTGVWTNTTKRTKIGAITKNTADASGDQVITGVGFRPNSVLFLAAIDQTPQMSVGFSSGSGAANNRVVSDLHTIVVNSWDIPTGYCIELVQGQVTTYVGSVSATSSDGFTITWEKIGAKTGTAIIYYLASEG